MFMRIAFGTNMFLGIFFEHMFLTIPYVHRDLFCKKISKNHRKIQKICKSICSTGSFSIFSPRVSSDSGDFFSQKPPLYSDLLRQNSPRVSCEKLTFSTIFLTISYGLAGEHMSHPCLLGYLDFKIATELGRTYVNPSPSAGNLCTIRVLIMGEHM